MASPTPLLRDPRPVEGVAIGEPSPSTRLAASCAIVASSEAVSQLRRFTRSVLEFWGVEGEAGYEVLGIVSELATNAVCHSGSLDVSLTMTMSGSTIVLTVRDSGRWKRRRRADPLGSLRGRGLLLVSELASRSGVHRSAQGTAAWAERVIPEHDLSFCRLRGTAC